MQIMTSFFAARLPDDILRISIALKTPPGPFLRFPALAPPPGLLAAWKRGMIGEEEYTRFFTGRLERLDGREILGSILRIMESCRAEKAALCCYEKPGDFCHRHLVADWLSGYGAECREWRGASEQQEQFSLPGMSIR